MTASDNTYFMDAERCRLDPEVMDFVRKLRGLLAALRPPMIEPASTLVRPEQGMADLVIGHRLLSGLGLAVGIGNASATVYWVSYSTMKWSDEFDDARTDSELVAGRFEGHDFMDATLDQVRRELKRKLRLRGTVHTRLARVEAFLDDRTSGRRRPIWRQQYMARWKLLLLHADERLTETVTSFMDDPEELTRFLNAEDVGHAPR